MLKKYANRILDNSVALYAGFGANASSRLPASERSSVDLSSAKLGF